MWSKDSTRRIQKEIVCCPLISFKSVESSFAHRFAADEDFFGMLTELPPSTLDVELRSLPLTHLSTFLDALTARLSSRKDFEAVQAMLSVFLRVQGDMLVSSGAEVRESMQRLMKEQERETKRIGSKIGYCTGVLSFVRNTPIA